MDIVAHVQREYGSSEPLTRKKREIFGKNATLYFNTKGRDEKILSKYIWSTVQTLKAVRYNDTMTVEFTGRQLGDETYANNLNKLAEFDHEEMNIATMQLKHDEDIFVYGV